jgi:DNA polymerase-3 subunit gamma/tau
VLIRLAYVADLPVPADLVRALRDGGGPAAAEPNTPSPPPTFHAPSSPPEERVGVRGQPVEELPTLSPSHALGAGPSRSRGAGEGFSPISGVTALSLAAPESETQVAPTARHDPMPQSFDELIALFDQHREAVIRSHLWSHVHLVGFEPGRIEFRPQEAAPRDLANRLGQLLGEWTGTRWVVAVSQAEGAPTLAEIAERRDSAMRNEVAAHPLVRAVLDAFPGATIAAVRERFAAAEPAAEATADEPIVDEDIAGDPGEDASTGEDGP